MTLRLSLAALAAAAVALSLSARAEDKESKTIELFNGKNLDGWKIVVNGKGDTKADAKKTWSVNAKEKTLVCSGAGATRTRIRRPAATAACCCTARARASRGPTASRPSCWRVTPARSI